MTLLLSLDGVAATLWAVSEQVTVLVALVWLAAFLGGKASPSFRYALWCVVLVRLCIPFSLSLPFGLMPDLRESGRRLLSGLEDRDAAEIAGSRAPAPPVVDRVISIASAPGRSGTPEATPPMAGGARWSWRERLLLGWLTGLILASGVVLGRMLKAHRIVERLPAVDRPALQERFAALRGQMGIRRTVELRTADSVLGESGPMTLGVRRPIVILPRCMSDDWPLEELEPVLRHELAHVKRLDLVVNWVQMVVQLVYFFHPLVWYVNRRLRHERELICDDLAVGRAAEHRGIYCRSILRLLEETQGHGLLAGSGIGMAETHGSLGRRIMRIMDHGYRGHRRIGRLGVAFIVLVGALCVAAASDTPTAVAIPTATAARTLAANETVDAQTQRVGEEVRKRLTTYSDEQSFTLSDGQTVDMKVKSNPAAVSAIRITAHLVAAGSEFDLRALDAGGRPVGPKGERSPMIHDGSSERMGVPLPNGRDVLCKIELTPNRGGARVYVEVKVLFATVPTAKETEAAMLSMGKEGELHLVFRNLATAIWHYKRDQGVYPASLDFLKTDLPKDIYSPKGEPIRYETERGRFILSSCGKDGVYGNDDDEMSVFSEPASARSGQRHELYPLEPVATGQGQSERLAPSGRRPTGTCLLAGTIVDDRAGSPIGHATVYLSYGITDDPLFVAVAPDGSFALRNVACGTASLTVTHTAGYQNAAYDPENAGGDYPKFTLAEKEERRDIVFRLAKSYLVSGRVLDEMGRPFSERGLYVVASALSSDSNARSFRKQANVRADGTYRLDGLPGHPILLAVQDLTAEQKDNPYPLRFYPGTFSRPEATTITFDSKASLEDLDIRLARAGGLGVEGRVTDADTGAPIANALVVVQYADTMFERVTAYTDAAGRYHIEGLGPGTFLVHADAKPQNYVRTKERLTLSPDVKAASLDFKLRRGVTITGTIVDNAGTGGPVVGARTFGMARLMGSESTRAVSMTGVRHKYQSAGLGQETVIYYDGEGEDESCEMIFPSSSTFLVTGLKPGLTAITLQPGVRDKQVVRVTYQGKDVKDSGIATSAGQRLDGVQIVLGTETKEAGAR